MKNRLMMGRQLFIALMFMVEALCVLIAVAFYLYNAHTLKTSEKARLASLCASATANIDNMVHSMDELSVGVTIADGFIPAMRAMAEDGDRAAYVDQIRSMLVKAYRSKTEAYRIVALSANGNSVSLGRNELSKSEVRELVKGGYWHQTDRRGNSKVLVGPFLDPWVKDNPQQIFSLLRAVRDGENLLGYIEVQMHTDRIAEAFQRNWRFTDLYYAIIDASGDGRLFFSNFGPEQDAKYMETIVRNAAWYPTDSIEDSDALISISASNYTEWKIAMVMPKAVMNRPLLYFLPMALAAALAMGLVIAVSFKMVVDRVTRPVARVVRQVREIELSSLDAPFERVSGSYESEVLSDAFETMKSRLAEALQQHKAIERMQTKVLLEALQSRIGPHFLNNTLGAIANMAASGDAQGAADACFSLSELLRYSSHYGSEEVTIRVELEHLKNYLLLMKGRYRHRLSYDIDAEADCLDTRILKLTIQPLVENAIKYSLSENECVQIGVTIRSEDGRVVIRVSDNGSGFEPAALEALDRTMQAFISDPSRFSVDEFAPKRGMGLAGTLLRLYLLLGEQGFHYRISNPPDGGGLVELRIG